MKSDKYYACGIMYNIAKFFLILLTLQRIQSMLQLSFNNMKKKYYKNKIKLLS